MSKKKTYSDQELIQLIKGGREDQNKAISALLSKGKVIGSISKMVCNMKGNEQDIEDVIQESLLRLMRQVQKNAFYQKSALSTYLISVAKFVMLEKKRKVKEAVMEAPDMTEKTMDIDRGPEEGMILLEREKKYQKAKQWLFDQLDEKCRKILKMVANGFTRDEIATEMDYSHVQTAKNNVSKCKKRLVEFALGNPDVLQIIKRKV